MPMPESIKTSDECAIPRRTVLELTVRNHPGVMSHVCGLFARRAFNVEGVLCMPDESNPAISRIWLLVNEDARLEQMTRQLLGLHDVLEVRPRREGLAAIGARLGAWFEASVAQ